jgi:hypothetical protein
MVMAGGGRVLVALLIVLLFFTSISSAEIIYDMQLLINSGTQWFTDGSDPSFSIDDFCSGIISTYSNPTSYDYLIQEGSVTVTALDLLSDNDPGGTVADGTFEGGAIMTVSGEVWEDGGSSALYDGVLLIAVMDSTDWDMTETPTFNKVTGQNYFTPSDTGTYEFETGANTGLIIGNFGAVFSMDVSQPTVTDFSTTDYTSLVPKILINAETPEPASLCLLAFGTLFITLKRKRS